MGRNESNQTNKLPNVRMEWQWALCPDQTFPSGTAWSDEEWINAETESNLIQVADLPPA